MRVEFKLLTAEPVPVWAAAVDVKTYEHRSPLRNIDLRKSFDVLRRYVEYRGVKWDRLQAILATGVDVEPTTHPIFVSDFDKAWEYGRWPKVVMAFDGRQLQPTYREVILSDTTADEIAQLMVDYPTRIESVAGDRVWLTRFPAADPRAASSYEAAFARWIPGDPFDALLAVFVFVPEGVSELDALGARLGQLRRTSNALPVVASGVILMAKQVVRASMVSRTSSSLAGPRGA